MILNANFLMIDYRCAIKQLGRFIYSKGLRPYLKLSRLDRPIGSWLLIIPCWWGVFLSTNVDPNLLNGNSLYILIACYIGGLLMRGAGCTWNDITDAGSMQKYYGQ